MTHIIARLSVFALSLTLCLPAHAFFSPASVSILPPVQFPPEDFSITGVRASAIYGQHRDVYGVDVGLIGNITEQDFVGIGVSGVFNLTRGQTTPIGLQAAGITNVNMSKTNVVGVQLAGVANYNDTASSVTGLQLSLANLSKHTKINGFQVGIYNRAETINGFQIGLVNRTKNLNGIQIGLVNFNATGIFKVSPILNIGF